MRSSYLPSILLVLCAVHGALSIPLNLEHGEATTDEEKANLVNLNAAKDEANNQITKMQQVLADPTNEKHKPLIDAAFGTDPSLNLNKVKENVAKLKSGTIKVHLPNEGNSKFLAATDYDEHMTPNHVEFGKKYHNSALSTQAGTMIHEASHFLGDTGDYIHDGKMLKGSNRLETDKTGYTSKQSFYKTTKSLNNDKTWTNMRDGHTEKDGTAVPATKNLHDNAESYAQFASLCANANLRRDLHMYRRALAVGDGETASFYLARRQSCALPKDYFAKKAAAKKAAAAKTGEKTTGAKVASTKKTAGARTLSTKGKAGAAKSLLKGAKSVGKLGSKSSLGKSKLGAVKHLANGRVAKSVAKVAGSRRPVSKAAGKRLTGKAGPTKHTATGSKRVGGATSKHVAKAAGNKHVARPISNKHTTAKTSGSKRVANNRAARPATNKAASRPGRQATVQAKPQRQVKAAPKPAAQKTVAKIAPKKGRRDLELEYLL